MPQRQAGSSRLRSGTWEVGCFDTGRFHPTQNVFRDLEEKAIVNKQIFEIVSLNLKL